MKEKTLVSIVTTAYRTRDIIPELIRQLKEELNFITDLYELIIVDDHSPDDCWYVIREESMNDPRIKGIRLSRNFGQQIATSAGLRFASGEYIIIMDGDLQNPPDAIPLLLRKLKDGYDIVYTTSYQRNGALTRLTSFLFWWFVQRVLKTKMIPNQLMMRGMTAEFVNRFNHYNELNRIVAGITADIGMKSAVLNLQNNKRHSGKSSYNLMKRIGLMLDIIIPISNAPLSFIIYFSLFIFVISLFVCFYYLFNYFILKDVPGGYTSIIVSLFLFNSLILFVLGIIGRYLSNIYTEVRNRPLFHVKETINFNE